MEHIKNDLFEFEVGTDGIGILSINQVNNPTNLFSTEFITAYIELANQVVADKEIKGMILTSGRSMFMPGADLRELQTMGDDPQKTFDGTMQMHQALRALETAGKPFVAAINGTAMGGGLELCLTCHHRIVLNSVKIKLGFPEAKVGLLPAGGGNSKVPYLLGIQTSLIYLLQGKEVRPAQALKDGLIDDLAESQEELIQKAKDWILANPNPVQPWDNKKHRVPGGDVWSANGVQTLVGAAGNLSKMAHGNYPAQNYIIKVIHDGLPITIDRALEIEARYFIKLLASKEAKNMIRTGFMELQKAKKGIARPKTEPAYEIKKLGILGAGMMGAGIAYVSAKAGMDVVLKDVSQEGAEKGKAYSKAILDKAISKNRSTPEKAEALLSKIEATTDPASMKDCDLVIEAVFEDPKLKAIVTAETEAVLGTDKVYASNTSTIPITELAKASSRPANFIGIHFFSPVEKMPLVEIIVGEKTEAKAIAAAVDYTVAIGKIPIVVNDSRGFYTSRCFGTFVSEGSFMVEEGVPAAMVENVAKGEGMAVGPLAVIDEVTLTLGLHVYESDPTPNKPAFQERSYKMQKDLVDNHGRKGKKWGAGFYDYPKGSPKKLWPGLAEKYNSNVAYLDKETVGKRILHRQAIEAFKCLEEGVLKSVVDGDLGSVLGWGFPIFTGGALSYIDFVGMQKFVAECDDFTSRFGARFAVPDALRALSEAGKSIHDYKK
ncbi:3-hydroxyacyl-CoA dehydrogenase NAD-binding domain-containing protein [Flavobacteriaceae bacterium]|nr:3-hydroxyacyl-CoA dehydrogenase NAD-binding domain-containing protein [Flavobacteriaceae bacterium]MDC1439003.1 3-hydroxyacyl-CoA dehydrogenase NAD-binding domain-containing protein [Flavobacteriaceae bacterium]|tara:strand:+ start:1221 stop:3374 length:2154 start_codon:yes stop_codon:yes gene_type:complete